jgi:hypothetical protein
MENKIILKSIQKLNPNAEVSILGSDINTCEITWHNGTTPISKADIEAQLTTVDLDNALEDVRIKRNGLLAETDYVALSDLQGTLLTTEMTNYRQALRDITNGLDTVEKCNNVTWPTKP